MSNTVALVSKLHFRDFDVLYLKKFSTITVRLAMGVGMEKKLFCEGIREVLLHPDAIRAAWKEPDAFIDALHSFPDLETVIVFEMYTENDNDTPPRILSTFNLHNQLAEGPWGFEEELAGRKFGDIFGGITSDSVVYRKGKRPLNVSVKRTRWATMAYFDHVFEKELRWR